jgi:predicted nicotinamide N-methyase
VGTLSVPGDHQSTMRSSEELAGFVAAHTALVSPPGCPEIKLHLATAMTSLWQASETFLAGMTVAPPYWSLAWAGSQGLARHVLENRWHVRGRRVLDFMAASGIAGIAAAQVGASAVEAFDADPLARAAIGLNAKSNGLSVKLHVDNPMDSEAHAPWEVLLVGDIGYEPAIAEYCLPWLRRRAAQGSMVLLSDPGGVYGSMKGMVHLADYSIPATTDPDDRSSREISVYRVGG